MLVVFSARGGGEADDVDDLDDEDEEEEEEEEEEEDVVVVFDEDMNEDEANDDEDDEDDEDDDPDEADLRMGGDDPADFFCVFLLGRTNDFDIDFCFAIRWRRSFCKCDCGDVTCCVGDSGVCCPGPLDPDDEAVNFFGSPNPNFLAICSISLIVCSFDLNSAGDGLLSIGGGAALLNDIDLSFIYRLEFPILLPV